MTRRYLFAGVLALAFALVFYISWLTPMHSDDFSYYNMGLGLENHLAHYRAWSGRFAADYMSALILSWDSQVAQAALTALAVVGAIYMIARMPSLWFGGKSGPGAFVFLFLLYWSACRILGQAVFWVVGAANYLFPLFFVVLYFYLFSFYAKEEAGKWKYFIPMLGAAVLAGCSNESTGWVAAVLAFMGAGYLHWRRQDRAIWLPAVLVLAGFLVLLLSPGNAARSAHPDFAGFYSISLFTRAWDFTFYAGFPKAVLHLMPFLVMAAVLLVAAYRTKIGRPSLLMSLLFVGCALASAYSMVMSPTFPERSLSGAVFFLLLACSFAYAPLAASPLRWARVLTAVMTACLAVVFVAVYVFMAFSYQRAALQDVVRSQVLEEARQAGKKEALIPAFFYSPSLRKGDGLDPYHNVGAAGEYHGFERVVLADVGYDYSVLLDGERYEVPPPALAPVFEAVFLGRAGLRGGTTVVLTSQSVHWQPQPVTRLQVVFFDAQGKQASSQLVPYALQPAPGGWMLGLSTPVERSAIQAIEYVLVDGQGLEISPRHRVTLASAAP